MLGITVLALFQLLGEVADYYSGGLVPGPVIGMALIFLALSVARTERLRTITAATANTSKVLLANLGLLFVPAGVGIIQHLDLIRDRGVALLVTIFVSTAVTLIVTVGCFLAVKHLLGGRGDG